MTSSNKYFVLIFAVTVSLSLLGQASAVKLSQQLLRKLFDCPPCSSVQCPQMSFSYDCEPVLRAGVCACCYQCARRLGERCGFHMAQCAKDLVCYPEPGTIDTYQALQDGAAICTPFDSVL